MKRFVSLLLTIVICISSLSVFVYAERDISGEEVLAQELKELGLFKGVSDTDFDLDRAPSRVEALVMLIRVLGRESEVSGGVWRHPFTDVPEWADKYVGFAYSNGLTNGQSLTEFGTGDASAAMFVTFVLRALGYSDENGADFVWSDPFTLAKTVGILPDSVNLDEFWRADVVTVAHSSLVAYLKGSEQTLAEKLVDAGVFTRAKFNSCYGGGTMFPKAELSAEEIYASCSGAVFYIEIYDEQGMATASGSGFFIDDKGTAVTNYHVIEDAYSAMAQLSSGGAVYGITGIYDYDIENDWAVIKVNCDGNKYLKVGDASTIVGAATVYTIGSPLGLQNTISVGIISNPARIEGGVRYIQTSAAISSGSSGGALINKYGEVIGITTGGYIFGQNLNLAIPMTALEGYSTEYLTGLLDFKKLVEYNLIKARQEAAYNLLKDFVIENHNATRGGKKEYNEKIEMSDKVEFTIGINYNDTDEELQICIDYYYDGALNYAVYTNLDRSNRHGYSYYYDFTHSTAYDYFTYGGSNISFASFNKDFDLKFESYTGTADRIERDERISKELHYLALDFADTVFSGYLGSEYSVADFGYTSFSVYDMRFTEIIPEHKNQVSAYMLLENFILENYTDLTSEGFRSYSRVTTVDGIDVALRAYYDEETEIVVGNVIYNLDDVTLMLYVEFPPYGQIAYVYYFLGYKDDGTVMSGALELDSCDFNAGFSYRFDEYNGDAEIREYNEGIAKIMHFQALAFMDIIFEDLLEVEYSVYDFGYTTFNAEDFQ